MSSSFHSSGHAGAEVNHYYRQATIPTTSDPLQVGDIWSDTAANLLKRCTSLSPVTFVSVEGGSAAHDLFSATHGDVDDTDTPSDNQVLRYDSGGGKWSAEDDSAQPPTFVVAASDANADVKASADYVCDGTADDVQIQAALDALPSQGGKVLLSEGTFTIAAAVNVPSNSTLSGSGYNTRLNRTTSGDVVNAIGSSGTHLKNIVVEGMRVTGPSVVGAQVAGVGIDLDYNDYSVIRYCWVSGFGSGGDEGGVRLRHAVACRVVDNYLSASKNGCVTGLSGSVDFPEADRCEISRNVVYDNFDDGLHSQQSARIVYNNNICYGNGEAGIDVLGDDGDIITGNHCYNNTGPGIEAGNSTATGSPDSGHTITGNVCNNNTTNGILLGNNCDFISVIGNTVRDNASHGIQIGGNAGKVVQHCNVTGNVCENNVDGIRLVNNADENLVQANVCRANTGRGIYIVDAGIGSPTNNVLMDNKASGNTTADIAQNGDTGTTLHFNVGETNTDDHHNEDHATRHQRAGADEVDGDKLDIDWNPSNYTPTTSPTEADDVDNLTAHLAGIDAKLADIPAVNPKVEMPISAASLKGTTTNGAGDADKLPESTETSTNKVNYDYLAFDTTTEENAYFQFSFPKGWDEGTITFRVKWTNTAGLTTETVVFGLKAIALSNDDALDTAWGTEVTVNDTWIAQNDAHISPESAAVTIGGTPAAGDIVFFNIARKTGSDDLTGDARLLEVILTFTRDTYTDA
ncbi:MAG: right-handed parallel beta-helix repeat-containing protein [Chloroflexi bacterium]|nr:right-handed parallel beta-helix repeat-containing protein [Chloroflexota bacterium]